MKKWIKPLGLLTLIILICSVIARIATGGETLSEYAQRNPKTAYATPWPTPMPSLSPTCSPSPAPVSNAGFGTPAPAVEAEPVPPAAEAEAAGGIHYQDGFFYQPLSDSVIARITGISYPISHTEADSLAVFAVNILGEDQTPEISYDDLRYLSVLYCDFEGETQVGELICHKEIAQDLAEIFYELYQNGYQIEKIRLIDEYNGDDTASMLDNNTSCFNYRVVDGTSSLSKHALGCAVDINPFYNPYVVFNKDGSGQTYISPSGSEIYADRSQNFPYKIDENDLCYKLFIQHGFIWGGNWNSCKDYQHFQKAIE